MKKFILFLLIILLLGGCDAKKEEKMRGAWVASVHNLDFPSRADLSPAQMKEEILYLLDGAQRLGLNAIFLQVRPCGDAIYPSEYYPWSHFLTGEQGRAPRDGFDPLKFWVSEAHKREIELHAWINPFRVTVDGTALSEDNIAKIHPEWTVEYDGKLYLNPGVCEAREYIVCGVREILQNYEVDGIHFDDYFYPGYDFDDAAQYRNNKISLPAWRRENINSLIRDTASVVRSYGISFGVSPFGIWRNESSDARGSKTSGQESYDAHFADTRRWVDEQIIDYIAPQIYWEIGHEKADFAELLNWWCDAVKGTNVKLYIGHAGYKADAWREDEMFRQLEMSRRTDGSIHYRLRLYLDSEKLCAALKNEYLNE